MATHSCILSWRIPGTEESGRLQSVGSQESDTTELINHIQIPIQLIIETENPTLVTVHQGILTKAKAF